MAISVNTQIENTVSLFVGVYGNLVRESEQLRILKNFTESKDVYSVDQIKTLIKAMEAEQ